MALASGTRLGPYEVAAQIGVGGMGEVYRATDTGLKRAVAVKVLPETLASDPDRLARFQREAEVLASLNHPNIAAIYGLERSGVTTALVMELVEGPTLADRIAQGAIPFDDVIPIARQIVEALEAAHEQGIIHRDLKPANVKVRPDGAVKVLDFGLAKVTRMEVAPADLTQSPTIMAGTRDGVILGTAAYMSPEQARGKDVDKRADIWAFGCVLFEMLTGRAPFGGPTTTDILAAILEREPDWSLLPARTPASVRRVLRRCLQKDPKDRLRDIADARMEIDEPDALPASLSSTSRRSRALLAPAVAAALAASAALWWSGSRVSPEPQNPLANAQFTRLTDFPGTESDAAISRDGRFVAFLADRDGPFDIWLNQIGAGRAINLTPGGEEAPRNAVRNVTFSPDGEIVMNGTPAGGRMAVMPLLGGAPRLFLGPLVINIDWSPDGTRVVYHTRESGDPMFVADGTGANARQIFVDGPGVHNHFPVWSMDGWIYFVRGFFDTYQMDIWRISPDGGQPERVTQHDTEIAYPTPLDSKTMLYVARGENRSGPWLWWLDTESKVSRRASLGLERFTSIAASADGRRLVATVANPTATLSSVPILSRVASERDVKPFALPLVRALAPRFGGTSLFVLSSQGTGDGLWRVEDGRASEIWKGSESALQEAPAIAPDGRRAAIVVRGRQTVRLQIVSADGSESRTLTDSIAVRGAADWSPDAKWIVTGGSDAQGPGLFKIPVDGGAPVRLVTGTALNPVWSPDGSLIVYAGVTVAIQAPLLAVRPDGTPVELPPIRVRYDGERYRFLPDGKGLVYMRGFTADQDFWLLDLSSKTSRQLTALTDQSTTRTFDITPDGAMIVFDRLRENSDVVLIDRP